MKYIFFALSFILFTSCAPAAQSVVAEPLLENPPTPTVPPITEPAPTLLLAISPTATQTVCDPFTVDFCITEGHFIFQNPIHPPGNTFVDVTYRYGTTQNNTRDPHHGVEFLNKFGTPVHAAGDGVVQFAGPDNDAIYSPRKDFYGKVVVIRHENEMYTLYAHLSKFDVEIGDEVKAGDQIGEVGQSGAATGSHLHFEVRKGGDGTDYYSTQNPELWLIPNNNNEDGHGLGAISFSLQDQNSAFQFDEFTARFFLDKDGPRIKSHYIVTYPPDMSLGKENAALGDLPAGYYYVALKYNGHLYERWVEVESGKLTEVVFVVK